MSTIMRHSQLKQVFRILSVVFIAIVTTSCMECKRPLADVEIELLADCWTCQLFSLVYDGVNSWASTTYTMLCSSTKGLLAIGFGLWLAINILKHISSFSPQNVGEFWTKVSKTIFIFVFASVVLSSQENTMWAVNYTVYPIIVGCVEFAAALTGGTCTTPSLLPGDINAAIPPGVGETIGCLIGSMSSALINAKMACIKMMCIADSSQLFGFIGGVIAWLALTVADIIFPLYLIDAVIRLGIVVALMPLFIASWVFESTRFFAKAGFKMCLNSGMNLVVMTVMLGLMSSAMIHVLGQFGNAAELDSATPPSYLVEALNGGLLVLQTIGIAILCLFSCTKAPLIANHFAPLHAQLDGTATAVIQIVKLAFEAAKAAASGGSSLGETAARMAAEKATKETAGKAGGGLASMAGGVGGGIGGGDKGGKT